MTREEAIDRLKEARAGHKEFLSVETLNMAIEALQKEPCEDCISRGEALSVFRPRGITEDVWKECDVYKKLTALPPVTPQQKVGRWKRISMDKYSEHAKYWYRCDRCGKDNLGSTDYCPNCGQPKMQEV